MPLDNAEAIAFQADQLQTPGESRAKFASDGRALLFPGVTVICHLREDGTSKGILRSIIDECYNDADKAKFGKYIQLPEESLHMTLYDTKVYNKSRGTDFSSTTDLDATRKDELIEFRQAFSDVRSDLQKCIPVKMTVDLNPNRHPKRGGVLVVPVKPFDEEKARKLRSIRETICSAFNMPPPDNGYLFHITIYYALQALSDEQFPDFQKNWSELVKRISQTVPTFEIDRIELCTFENMRRFDVQECVSSTS